KMTLPDDINLAYLKQVALDWRELVRERKDVILRSPTMSMVESLPTVAPIDTIDRSYQPARPGSMVAVEKRESSFYRGNFGQAAPQLQIEHRRGSMEAARIRVNEVVNLYIYPPIPVTEELRRSLTMASAPPIPYISS
ncbi:hypothetical protein KR009_003871, partial [Drosophila setifemur]